jgi:hypothetical protein
MAIARRSSASWARRSSRRSGPSPTACRSAAAAGGAGARPSGAGLRLARLPQPGDGRLPVDPDPGDDAGAVALPVPERQRAARQQRPVGPAEHPRAEAMCRRTALGLVLLGLGAGAGLGYVFCAWVVSGKFGSIIRGIRDDEARVRFLGYPVEGYKLFVFTLTAVIAASRARSTTRRRASSTRPRSRPSPRSTWPSGSPSAGAGGSTAR